MPVAAVGFYLMGVEQSKRNVEFYLQLANGSYVDASSEVTKGPRVVFNSQPVFWI